MKDFIKRARKTYKLNTTSINSIIIIILLVVGGCYILADQNTRKVIPTEETNK